MKPLGFARQTAGAYVLVQSEQVSRVWLQKFAHQPAFRVWTSFQANTTSKPVVESSDRFTYRDSPAGRQFDFSVRFADDAAERCLSEIREFVETVAIPWLNEQA